MKKSTKIITILLTVFLPIGMLYCIGKNLFTGNFITFLGALSLFATGFVVSMLTLRPDILNAIKHFFGA